MSEIFILGAYGSKSIKGGSSAFRLNHNHVIDAGNLLVPLGEESVDLDAVWLTHSHLDHIVDLAYILDTHYDIRTKTLKIYGLQETIDSVRNNFFNDAIWPDFSRIPLGNGSGMTMSYHIIEPNKPYQLSQEDTIEAFLTDHTVKSCGYIVQQHNAKLLITADTLSLDTAIERIENEQIRSLVVECSFPNRKETLAITSKHLTPKLLFQGLQPLEGRGLQLYINHLKPAHEDEIRAEIEEMKGRWNVTILHDGDVIHF